MPFSQKVLWVVNYDELDRFVDRALACRVTGVAIRTDNNLPKAITAFHDQNIQVFGWRWPSARKDAALKEAAKVASLFGEGLDGYFVDPEGATGQPWDWNQPGLESLALAFCETIKNAAPAKPLGLTSHYRAKDVFPKLPWASFAKHADLFLPQAYWRSTAGTIGHGIPADNYKVSFQFWSKIGAAKEKTIPMAGELGVASAAEIGSYCAQAAAEGVSAVHFYTFEETVKASVWAAIQSA